MEICRCLTQQNEVTVPGKNAFSPCQTKRGEIENFHCCNVHRATDFDNLSPVSRQVVLASVAQHFLMLMLIKLHTKKEHFEAIYLSFGQFGYYCQL